MRGLRAASVLALAAATASIAAAAPSDPVPEQSRATALVAQVTVPGQPTIATTLYEAPPVVNGGMWRGHGFGIGLGAGQAAA